VKPVPPRSDGVVALGVLIGRGRELEELDGTLVSAEAGRGALRIVVGEPGIGKTRLADEVAGRAAARKFFVAWGRAWETGGAPPYWPWVELLRPVAEAFADTPPRVAALLDGGAHRASPGDGTHMDSERERFELFDEVGSWLRACSRRAPLLLIFDDLHVADVASLELLSFVAGGMRGSRMAILATHRDAESRLPSVAEPLSRVARHGEVRLLRPLSGQEVAEVVRHETGHSDVALSDELFALTEGNPLFLRETLHALATGPRVHRVEAIRGLAVSGGIMALVRSRLAGADPQANGLLETAATLGREVALGLFAEVARLTTDVARRVLDDATTRGLLAPRSDDRWVFSHVLVREAFYQQIPAERRRTLHARVASALASRIDAREDVLAVLAHHALAALSPNDTAGAIDAMRVVRRAADQARVRLAYEEAIALLERGLAACEACGVDDRERVEVLLALGWARTEGGRLAAGRDAFRSAATIARHVGDSRLLARAALGQGGQYVLAEIRSELSMRCGRRSRR
jgi:predicted ATPase